MINMFVVRKWAALIIPGLFSAIMYALGTLYYGVIGGAAFMVAGTLLGAVVGRMMLHNPFTAMLEGKGILVLDLNSTGIIRPFLMQVDMPYMRSYDRGKAIEDIFDRDAVHQLSAPVKVSSKAVRNYKEFSVPLSDKEKKELIKKHKGEKNYKVPTHKKVKVPGTEFFINEEDYNDGRFALYQYPVVIWNSALDTVLTKNFLSQQEKSSFAKHGILYVNKKIEELTSHIRDFGRSVVENLRPKLKIGRTAWIIIIVVIFIILILLLFGPSIQAAFQSGGSALGSAGQAIGTANPVTPN